MQCISNVCLLPRADGGNASADADPSQADADDTPSIDADLCSSGTQTIEATGAIVDFVVPACVTSLTIEVFGAEGGSGNLALVAVLGGKGARMKGDFAVTEGETLKVLVGESGAAAVQLDGIMGEQAGGSGGGGSFVVASNGDAMIIAGGGGGATHIDQIGPFIRPGNDADVGTSGGTGGGDGPGVGGQDGQGGGTYAGVATYHSGTGGGGFLSAGLNASLGDTTLFGTANNPGASYAEGGAGGIGGSKGRNGGFGGGGSSGFTGGGGGGYSGGGAGGSIMGGAETGGGGGGSFNAGTNPDNSAGAHIGDGQVIMTWVVP
jgi:hypothetical protein